MHTYGLIGMRRCERSKLWQKIYCLLIPIQRCEDTYRELLLLSRQYHNVISLLIKAKMNLGNLLDQVMPGITSIIRDDRGSKLTEFVKKYVHFQHIDSMGEARFVRDFCK